MKKETASIERSIWKDKWVRNLKFNDRDSYDVWWYILTGPGLDLRTGLFEIEPKQVALDVFDDTTKENVDKVLAALLFFEKSGRIDLDRDEDDGVWIFLKRRLERSKGQPNWEKAAVRQFRETRAPDKLKGALLKLYPWIKEGSRLKHNKVTVEEKLKGFGK